jgi:hypothetical protein
MAITTPATLDAIRRLVSPLLYPRPRRILDHLLDAPPDDLENPVDTDTKLVAIVLAMASDEQGEVVVEDEDEFEEVVQLACNLLLQRVSQNGCA